jgi:hypothetical protein
MTLTFPAVLRDPEISIVVAPFNALKKDYVRRLGLRNIEHVASNMVKLGMLRSLWSVLMSVIFHLQVVTNFTCCGAR